MRNPERKKAALEVEAPDPAPDVSAAHFDFGSVQNGYIWNFPKVDGYSIGAGTFIGGEKQNLKEIAAKYAGYIDRQRGEVERAAFYEHLRLPESLDYLQVSALSIEARQKLAKHRPETLGQASRISGITPASVSLLLIHLKKGGFKGFMQTADDRAEVGAQA